MEELAQSLAKTRKQRKFPDLSPLEEVKRLKCAQSQNTFHHKTAPGVLCVDVHKADPSRIVTGGVDCQVVLYNAQKQKKLQTMVGHSKKVTAVKLHGDKDVVVSASQDATAKVWTSSGDWTSQYNCLHTIHKHRAEVTDLSIHPLGDYLLTASLDKSWAIHDFATGRCVRHMKDLESAFPSMSFHPDGLIVAGGTEDKSVIIWDVKNEQATVATLTGHESVVETLSFSGNGYYLASGSRDGVVKLWDLRKPVNLQTLQVEGGVSSVCFDATGQYLAVASNTVQVFNFETKTSLTETVSLKDHTDAVTGLCWGPNAKTLASVSMDHSLKVYSA
eukprot:Skav223223  [mRNA]  locus=scaffold2231:133882:138294:+ [translate_table: standard]